ncbi:hypothetical protein KY289_008821 [Solanum tuberosum]|nr:hypothetical protein KY289_008821 [Solanum tuberosum]
MSHDQRSSAELAGGSGSFFLQDIFRERAKREGGGKQDKVNNKHISAYHGLEPDRLYKLR